MPVNEAFVGREYPPTPPYAVGSAKIREFAEAVGSTDPVHVDSAAARAAGYRDVIAPPTPHLSDSEHHVRARNVI